MTKTVWSILNPTVFIITNMIAPIRPAPVSIKSTRAVISDNATAVPHISLDKACDGLQYAQQTFRTMSNAAFDAISITNSLYIIISSGHREAMLRVFNRLTSASWDDISPVNRENIIRHLNHPVCTLSCGGVWSSSVFNNSTFFLHG